MKLRAKIIVIFSFALLISIAVIFFGLTDVLDNVSSHMLKKQAESSTLYLQHTIIDADSLENEMVADGVPHKIALLKHVSDQAKGFEVSKILLINKELKVLAGYPDAEVGASYAAHADIRDAFQNKAMTTLIEADIDSRGNKTNYIDVVSYFTLRDGTPLVLEVRLDFAKTLVLLERQYNATETRAILFALTLLSLLLGVLLTVITRTAIKPVVRITKAMEDAGSGHLDVVLAESGHDEFASLAHEFNRMVEGIKEKLKLSQYVSKGTLDAVTDSVRYEHAHVAIRKQLIVFFSDIRGFTAYAENRDPNEVIQLLNEILSLQARAIKKHGGDVDKFVGDAVMAVFESANQASAAALEIQAEMQKRLAELQNLQLGIGVHQGLVMQGDVGSESVKNFTVIGDVVNTAARLESMAGPGEILISIDSLQCLTPDGSWLSTFKGSLLLKGKTVSINAYLLSKSSL